jgi:hypothetical protein
MVAVGKACRLGRYYPVKYSYKNGKASFHKRGIIYTDTFLFTGKDIVPFRIQNPARIQSRNIDFKNVYKAVLVQIGVYIPSAPVEEKGYKRMINLPDWLNMQNIFLKI